MRLLGHHDIVAVVYAHDLTHGQYIRTHYAEQSLSACAFLYFQHDIQRVHPEKIMVRAFRRAGAPVVQSPKIIRALHAGYFTLLDQVSRGHVPYQPVRPDTAGRVGVLYNDNQTLCILW